MVDQNSSLDVDTLIKNVASRIKKFIVGELRVEKKTQLRELASDICDLLKSANEVFLPDEIFSYVRKMDVLLSEYRQIKLTERAQLISRPGIDQEGVITRISNNFKLNDLNGVIRTIEKLQGDNKIISHLVVERAPKLY